MGTTRKAKSTRARAARDVDRQNLSVERLSLHPQSLKAMRARLVVAAGAARICTAVLAAQAADYDRLVNARKALIAGWTKIAEILEDQGEIALAGDVRYFARRLPPLLTDKERLAVDFVCYQQGRSHEAPRAADPPRRDRRNDFAR